MSIPKIRYTEAENDLIRRLYPTATAAELEAALPCRAYLNIARQAATLGILRRDWRHKGWSEADKQVLRLNYPLGGSAVVQPLLSRYRRPKAIQQQAQRQGVHYAGPRPEPRRYYTPQEQQLLRDLYCTAPLPELVAAFPNRSLKALSKEARSLGLARRAIVWPAEQVAYVQEHYATQGPKVVAQAIGRSERQVISKAHQLGITCRKPAAPKPVKQPKPALKPVQVAKPKPAPKPVAAPKVPQHNPIPKAKNTLKPLLVVGATTKASPRTPVLNATKAERQRAEKAVKQASIIDDLKRLGPDSEGRRIYTQTAARFGGPAATQAFRDWQKQQAA